MTFRKPPPTKQNLGNTPAADQHAIQQGESSRILRLGASSSFMINIAGIGLAYISHALIARTIGASEYGVYAYVIAWMNILIVLAHFGLPHTLLRYVPVYRSKRDNNHLIGIIHFGQRFVLYSSFALASLVAVCVHYFLNHTPQLQQAFFVGCLLIPLIAYANTQQAVLKGYRRVIKAILPLTALRPACIISAILICFLIGNSPSQANHMIMLNVGVSLIPFLFLFVWTKQANRAIASAPETTESTEWLRVATPLLFSALVIVAMKEINVILLGLLSSTDQSGYFNAATKISNLLVLGLASINIILAPIISELYHNKRHNELQQVLRKSARWSALFSLTALLILVLSGKWILGLFGDVFTTAYAPLIVLLFGQLFNACTGSVGFIMNMTGHQNQSAIIMATSLILNVILNILLIPNFGMLGSAMAIAITQVFWNSTLSLFIYKKLKLISLPF